MSLIWNESIPTLAVYPQESGHQQHLVQVLCTCRDQTQWVKWHFTHIRVSFIHTEVKLKWSGYKSCVFVSVWCVCVCVGARTCILQSCCLLPFVLKGSTYGALLVHGHMSTTHTACLHQTACSYTQKTQLFFIWTLWSHRNISFSTEFFDNTSFMSWLILN